MHSTSPHPMVLGDLADPTRYQSPIEILGRDRRVLLNMYVSMLKIRLVEQKLAQMRSSAS